MYTVTFYDCKSLLCSLRAEVLPTTDLNRNMTQIQPWRVATGQVEQT